MFDLDQAPVFDRSGYLLPCAVRVRRLRPASARRAGDDRVRWYAEVARFTGDFDIRNLKDAKVPHEGLG